MVDTVVGTDSPSYTPVSGDVAANIYCRVTATNAGGAASANSNTVGPVASAGVPPSITTAPVVTIAGDGASVTCSTGTWSGDPTITYAYQWFSDEATDVLIPGATSATYVIDGGVIVPWTPADLPGLVAWYDATTGVYSDAGTTAAVDTGEVHQWNDRSGHNYHLLDVAGAGTQIAYDINALNGFPAVIAPGGASNHSLATTESVAQGGGALMSCFAVCQLVSGADPYGRLISYLGTGETSDVANNNSGNLILRNSSLDGISTYRGGAVTADITLATNYRLGIVYGATNVVLYINNAVGVTNAFSANFTSPGKLIFGLPPSGLWAGPVGEIVITNTELSSGDRTSLDNYFKAKWGLT